MKSTERKGGLGRAMLLYALIFLILLGAGIFALRRYLEAYENASAPTAVNAWIDELDDEHAFRLTAPSLARFDNRVCPAEEIFARYAAPLLHKDLHAVCDAAQSTPERERWLLLSGRQRVGSLTLERGGETLERSVTPTYDKQANRAMIGVMSSVDLRYPGVIESAQLAVQKTGSIIYMMLYELYKIILKLSGADLAGPIGVAQMAGEVAEMGIVPLAMSSSAWARSCKQA